MPVIPSVKWKSNSSTQIGLKSPSVTSIIGNTAGVTIIGGTATTADLSFQTTSGVGTTNADMHFLVGNNGATEAMTILNSGFVGIGTTGPTVALDVVGAGKYSTALTVGNALTVTAGGATITAGSLGVNTPIVSGYAIDSGVTTAQNKARLNSRIGVSEGDAGLQLVGNFQALSSAKTNGYGLLISPSFINNVAGADFTNIYGAYINSGAYAAEVTNAYGMYVAATNNAVNNYGVYIAAPINGTTRTGLYNAGTSALMGNVGIGYADPGTAALAISGNVGIGTTSPTNLLSLGGEAARIFWMERELTADTAGNTFTITAGGATSGATDKAGGALILQGGLSTGDAESGVTIQGCVAGASGTADRTQTTAFQVLGNKLAFFAQTPVVRQTELTDELTTITHTAPGKPDYALQDLVQNTGFGFATADEGNTALSVIANLQARVNELETKLTNYGLLIDAD